LENLTSEKVNKFLKSIDQESRFALLVDLVPDWARLGAGEAMCDSLKEITGL
jgi:hypothetical protein